MQRFVFVTTLALSFAAAPALAMPREGARLGAAFSGGQNNLEGPAITGTDDREGKDETGYGFKLFGGYGFGDYVFTRGAYDFTLYDGDLSLHEIALGAGAGLPLYRSGDFGFYASVVPSLEIAVTDGTRKLAGPDGSGEDGSDVGGSFEGRFDVEWRRLGAHVSAAYVTFGEGDGPAFSLGARYALTDHWSALAGWEGKWVEAAGFNIDLAYQRFLLGFERRF